MPSLARLGGLFCDEISYFDDVVNRTTSHVSAGYNYQARQFNRLASTATANFVYDANGNLTSKAEGSKRWSFAWDHDNRLTMAWSGKDRVRYRYDALGRRVQRIVPSRGENTKFTYDGDDVLVDDNNGVLTKYINGPGVDNKLKMTTNGTVRYFVTDHLGSTNALTDASGAIVEQTKYDSFGNATANLSTRYQFTDREFDNLTGLHYYRARWYDASVGRFISEDPIGFAGGDVNLYGYVGNSPILNVDPRGLEVEATFSRSQGKMIVKDKWGGLGIWDWWYGPKSTNEYDVFSGNCQCDETTVGGPIPKGLYLIDKDHDAKGDMPWKRISYRLYASESGTMSGPFRPQKELTDPNTGQKIIRDNFYIHPGSVSLGCVTFKKDSNLEDGAPWSPDYEALDRTLKGTSPMFVKGDAFAGTLIVVD